MHTYMSSPKYPLSVSGFLSLGTADIILCWGKEGCLLNWRVLSMHWIAMATLSSVATTKNVSRHCQVFSGVQNSLHVKSTDLCSSDILDQTLFMTFHLLLSLKHLVSSCFVHGTTPGIPCHTKERNIARTKFISLIHIL